MECMFCKKKEYYIMKAKCNHYVCLNCINNNKECKLCNKLLLPKINKQTYLKNSLY